MKKKLVNELLKMNPVWLDSSGGTSHNISGLGVIDDVVRFADVHELRFPGFNNHCEVVLANHMKLEVKKIVKKKFKN